MGKITINEIHKSLFGYIQAVSDKSLETKDKTIVGAINELIQNSNSNKTEINNLTNEISNGKQLIANAIGEPLNAEDTFTEMSTDINSLLSTFKTNMMNNGVTVESSDKFKSLIDKIATMVEEGKGKGVNFKIVELDDLDADYGIIEHTITFNDLGFVPNYGFLFIDKTTDEYISFDIHNVCLNGYETQLSEYAYMVTLSDLTSSSIKITTNNNMEDAVFSGLKYYAIGVGEEDTTLSGGLDIISATTLPATGKKNQICVVTNNPVNNFVLTTSNSDITTNTSPIYGKLGYGTSDISGTVTIGEGIQTIYRVDGFFQNGKRQNSYIYQNSQWNQFTKTGISIIRDKAYCTDTQLYGEFPTYTYNGNVTFEMQEGEGLDIYNYSSEYLYYSFIPTAIDISAFNRIVLKWEITSYGNSKSQYLYILGSSTNPGKGRIGQSYTDYTEFAWTRYVYNDGNIGTLTADISDMTGTYYIGIGHYYAGTGGLYVYDFYLE